MQLPALGDNEIEDRYFLLGRMEILSVLNELIHRREHVTLYYNGGHDFFQTILLEARADALVFDMSGDAAANRKLLLSPSCVFVAYLDGIRVQFSGRLPARFAWGDSDAFWVALPERLVRVQRREYYRILLPVARPLLARLTGGDGIVLAEWPSHDLSVGGLGLVVTGEPMLEAGQDIARVQLQISAQIFIDCAAQVRHVTLLGEHRGGDRYRVGLSFTDLPAPTAVAIQRHITRIEHERRGNTV